MVLKILLAIALSFLAVWCGISAFTEAFIWEGLIRAAVAAVSVLLLIGLLRLGREKDEEDDGLPRREEP